MDVATSATGLRAAWDRITRVLPWAVDAAVVGGVAVVALVDLLASGGGPTGRLAILAGLAAVVLASGRRWGPLVAFGLLVGLVVGVAVLAAASADGVMPLAPTVALAALATPVVRREPPTIATAAAVSGGLAVVVACAAWHLPIEVRLVVVIGLGGVYGMGIAAGLYLRHLDGLQVRAADDARRAERLDIARELHDLVAHYVTGIVVQAQAAQVVAERDPAAATSALARIEDAGRDALVAMRGMVGSLRATDPDGSAPTAPPVGMAGLDDLGGIHDLAGRSRTAGLPVTVQVAPDAGSAVCGATATSVHRIVQESLTNVHRHAVDATQATVDVHLADDRLVVTVTDDGRQPVGGAGDPTLIGAGFGLVGMAERAEALAGTLAAGPLDPPLQGWRVQAVLPLDHEMAR